jgi:predicted outer membrane repeat protein
VLALGIVGCGETSGTGGTAGGGGSGGAGGDGGTGGTVAQCVDNVCRCTEAGIRAAIAAGGAEPYTFDCSGPTTVVTRRGEIDIDNDVTLDGRGMLTIHGNNAHRVLHVAAGVTALLRGITVTGGVERPYGVGDEDGGGILNQGHLTLENCTVEGNTAPGSGGGIMNGVVGTNGDFVLTLRNSRVLGNTAGANGGGIVGWGVITLTDSTVSGNTGGGIGCACDLTLTNSTVSDNTKLGDNSIGGGIMQNARLGSFTLTNSTVSGNTSGYICGGIYSKGVITLTNSTVSYNTASSDGGGICVAGEATLTNSTVSHNTAAGGGGIENLGVLRLMSSTISGNVATAQTGGSAIHQHGRVESSMATLIDGDCSPSAVRLTSRGYNIESPGDTCGFDQGIDRPDRTADELNLGPLQDNGGPTMTHALRLLPTPSVAIDHIPEADCTVDTDQRGEPRPVAILGAEPRCDVGAFEVQP